MDNVFIQRLWRSLKYEEFRLWSYGSIPEVIANVGKWMNFYNHDRIHQALDYQTPWSHYRPGKNKKQEKKLTNQENLPPRGKEPKAA